MEILVGILVEKSTQLFNWTGRMIMCVLLFFEDVRFILSSVLFLIILDWGTGVWDALRKKEFNWNKFKNGYRKVILYLLVLISSFIYEKYILELDAHYFTKGVGAIIGIEEFLSIVRHTTRLTNAQRINKLIKEFIKKSIK